MPTPQATTRLCLKQAQHMTCDSAQRYSAGCARLNIGQHHLDQIKSRSFPRGLPIVQRVNLGQQPGVAVGLTPPHHPVKCPSPATLVAVRLAHALLIRALLIRALLIRALPPCAHLFSAPVFPVLVLLALVFGFGLFKEGS